MSDPHEIESSRLFLRSLTIADAEAICRYRSNKDVNKYQGWIPDSIDDVYDFIENRVSSNFDEPETWFQYVIVLKNLQFIIGDIGLHFLESDSQKVELGCTLDVEYQGQGFAMEALESVIQLLFDVYDKKQMFAVIDPDNCSSIGLFKRLGFLQENDNTSIHIIDVDDRDLVFTLSKKD